MPGYFGTNYKTQKARCNLHTILKEPQYTEESFHSVHKETEIQIYLKPQLLDEKPESKFWSHDMIRTPLGKTEVPPI